MSETKLLAGGGCTDVHAHVFPLGLPDLATELADHRWPTLLRDDATGDGPPVGRIVRDDKLYRRIDESYWALEPRLDWMDASGVERQVVSPLPVLLTYWAEPRTAHDFARRQNEAIAEYVARAPEQLIGFGTVPLQAPERAIEALGEVRALGLRGVEIGSHAGPMEFDRPEMRPFFEAAAEMDVPLLLHPLEAEGMGRVEDQFVRFGVGVPADTGLTGAFILLSELLVDLPNLRLCLCHGGGSFFWSLPRMRRMLQRRSGREAVERMIAGITSVFVDSAGLDATNLRYLFEHVGSDRIVIGSDYPAAAVDPPLEALADPSMEAVRTQISVDNANRFLATPEVS